MLGVERLDGQAASRHPVRAMMLFPIDDLLDEGKCYQLLLDALHPEGLHCPNGHTLPADQAPHHRHRAPIVNYRCRECHRIFNVFTATALEGTRHPCSRLVLILRGFAQGVPTLHLANELGISRRNLLPFRHRVQALALERFSPPGRARRGHGSRRDVPERWREGPAAR
jgi:transposase-like protein